MDYELSITFVLVSISFIFTILAVLLQNKVLRFLFLLLLMWSLPLVVSTATEIVELNDDGSLTNLLTLMGAAYFLSMFSAILVTAYLMVVMIVYMVERFRVSASTESPEDFMEEAVS